MIVSVVINALWQGALVLGVTILTLRFVPLRNATTRYAAWFVTALSLVAVPLLSTFVHWHLPIVNAIAHGTAFGRPRFTLTALAPLQEQSTSVAWAIAAVWVAGTAFALARLAVSYARIARLRRTAAFVSKLAGIPVFTANDLSIPIAAGILAPAILIPRELFETLSGADLECTIEHELAHVRRGDVATNLVERLLEAAFFWNPWMHFVGRRLAAEREAACDDWAVHRLGEPSAYASCLAQLGRRLQSSSSPLLTPSALGSQHSLVSRIERLMADRAPNESKLNYIAVGGISMLVAILTFVLQTIVPMPAQATGLSANSGLTVAATCANPNAEPQALNAVAPNLPKSEWPTHKVTAIVVVKVTPAGKAARAAIYRSSGDAKVDQAAIKAAEQSTYTPRLVNCTPEEGVYLFRADFAP
ncbi:MAG TPA: M56 family metallopeptidase [Candidatus Cybelea sp.]|jgi:TonB family protein|nr:M56 family metallopeptidase [Candidatus Cybelea sp.]